MARYMGMDYEMCVKAYFKVAMAYRRNEDDIEDESFDATKDLYKHESDVKVIDIEMTDFNHDKHFTFADVTLDLRVSVRASDYDEACEQAESVAESVDCPVGVSYIECEAYEGEVTGEAIDYDWVVGE